MSGYVPAEQVVYSFGDLNGKGFSSSVQRLKSHGHLRQLGNATDVGDIQNKSLGQGC
jgi:hypothetical protein